MSLTERDILLISTYWRMFFFLETENIKVSVVLYCSKHICHQQGSPLVDKLYNVNTHNIVEGCFLFLLFLNLMAITDTDRLTNR